MAIMVLLEGGVFLEFRGQDEFFKTLFYTELTRIPPRLSKGRQSEMKTNRRQLLMFNIDAAAWEDRKYNEESRFLAHVEIRSPTVTTLSE
nr:hypothetical protein [Tanacetum cinerariifolium]